MDLIELLTSYGHYLYDLMNFHILCVRIDFLSIRPDQIVSLDSYVFRNYYSDIKP